MELEAGFLKGGNCEKEHNRMVWVWIRFGSALLLRRGNALCSGGAESANRLLPFLSSNMRGMARGKGFVWLRGFLRGHGGLRISRFSSRRSLSGNMVSTK